MASDKICVSGDSRVQYRSAFVNGKTYGYLYSEPKDGRVRGTVFLIHGFPDLSMGWRYQIPMFIDKGFRVIAPDCLGYGRTDAPDEIAPYSHKSCADDVKELASQLGASKIILGGHDWGAYLAYRVALWHPDLVSHLFTVCVPYAAPQKKYFSIQEMVATVTPHFAYQLQFISGDLEKVVHSREDVKKFLISLYGGRTHKREFAFDVNSGVDLAKMPHVLPSWLLSEEEMEYYSWEFTRNGVHGPLNWYRTREINYKDELNLPSASIKVPVLFVQALRDAALPPHLGKSMAKYLPDLTIKQVDTAHWALWEKPEEVNAILREWLDGVVLRDSGAKL